MRLCAGTSGYAYKPWKGKFYPADLPDGEMLRYYGERFRAVEINNTFYRMPTPVVLDGWAGQVPEAFRFVLKAPQRITHLQRLKDAGAAVAQLIKVAGTLKSRLGPLLFRLPEDLSKDISALRDFLALLPGDCRAVMDFRHQSWFDDEVFSALRERGAALCIADAESGLEVPFVPTAGWGYLRLRRPDYDDAALAAWIKRIREQAWDDAFVFFRHEDEARGPRLAARFMELMELPKAGTA